MNGEDEECGNAKEEEEEEDMNMKEHLCDDARWHGGCYWCTCDTEKPLQKG